MYHPSLTSTQSSSPPPSPLVPPPSSLIPQPFNLLLPPLLPLSVRSLPSITTLSLKSYHCRRAHHFYHHFLRRPSPGAGTRIADKELYRRYRRSFTVGYEQEMRYTIEARRKQQQEGSRNLLALFPELPISRTWLRAKQRKSDSSVSACSTSSGMAEAAAHRNRRRLLFNRFLQCPAVLTCVRVGEDPSHPPLLVTPSTARIRCTQPVRFISRTCPIGHQGKSLVRPAARLFDPPPL